MTKPATHHTLRLLLVNVGVLAVGVIVLELIFGNWIRPDNLNRLNIVRSRTVHFDVSALYDSPTGVATYTRDANGLRGDFDDPADIDILTIGGSTTDQRYVSDDETWQAVMQRALAAAGKDVVVANAGVDGQSSYGHIKNFDWWFPHIPGLAPRYVLFYVGNNDFYKDAGYGMDALLLEQEPSFVQSVKDKSAVYHVMRTLKGVYKARMKHHIGHEAMDFAAMEWTTEPIAGNYEELMRVRLKEYAERLRVLVERTRAMGAEAIFVTQPSYRHRIVDGRLEGVTRESDYDGTPINGVDHYYMMDLLDRTMHDVCEETGSICVDLSRGVTWNADDFYDFAHNTPKGARKIGEYLAQSLGNKFGP